MIDGREPKIVEFYTNEFIQNMNDENKIAPLVMRDLRLVRESLLWIHSGEGYRLEELILSIKDINFKSKCRTWMFINQFDFNITFDKFKLMSNDEIQDLMKTKPYIIEAGMNGNR